MEEEIADPFVTPMFSNRPRLFTIAGACVGVLALIGLTSVALSRSEVKTASATQAIEAQPVVQPVAAPVVAAPIAPPIELDTPPPPPTTTAEPAPVEQSTKVDPKKRFGKLTIKSDAKHKNVCFDGKRMLGSGKRTFMVFCGIHTIAVGDKLESKDVEIPCNGEYSVGK